MSGFSGFMRRLFSRSDAAEPEEAVAPIAIVLLSWERPLYLWASLDSLYRSVAGKADIYLYDNDSQDPLVRKVIAGFERRGLFKKVTYSPFNDPQVIRKAVDELLDVTPGPYIIYMETDVVVPTDAPNWISRMRRIMDANPKLGMLGSQVDTRDFVDVDDVVKRFDLELTPAVTNILKPASPERRLALGPDELADPHNPPGRLLMLRKEALATTGMGEDGQLYKRMKEAGWDCAITGAVVHRHLSFQNFFDYPDYDMEQRDNYVRASR